MKKAFFAGFLCLGIIVGSVFALNFGRKTSMVSGLVNSQNSKAACKSAYLVDYDTQTVIYKLNENNRYPIASMTKIMTLLLAFEDIDSGTISLSDKILVSERAASMGGSQAFLEEGKEYSLSDLIKTVVVASANDSSLAIAEKLSGSVENFVTRMNRRAKELGMENTLFVNCTGLPAPEQYSSSRDVSTMTRALLAHEGYYSFTRIWTEDFSHPTGRITTLTNTNKLVRFYEGCDSGKTGFTNEAGHCISASAKRGNMRLIATVIGAENSKDRFALAKDMLDMGFNGYECKTVVDCSKQLLETVRVKGGKAESVSATIKESFSVFLKKGDKLPEYTREIVLSEVLAPIKIGDAVGKLIIKSGETVVKEIPIISLESVEQASFKDIIDKVIKKWLL